MNKLCSNCLMFLQEIKMGHHSIIFCRNYMSNGIADSIVERRNYCNSYLSKEIKNEVPSE